MFKPVGPFLLAEGVETKVAAPPRSPERSWTEVFQQFA